MLGTPVLRLLDPIRKWVWKLLTVGEHSGITIVDLSRAQPARKDYLRRTAEALELLQRVDRRRFRRVRDCLSYIVHRELPFAHGQYDPQLSACYVDFTRLDFRKDPHTTLWFYAAILVHEATHAVLHRWRIPHSPTTGERVERLYNTESARFLRRHTRKAGDRWEQIMNRPGRRPRAWTATRWDSLAALWQRRRATAQMATPQSGANVRQPFRSNRESPSAAAASRRSH